MYIYIVLEKRGIYTSGVFCQDTRDTRKRREKETEKQRERKRNCRVKASSSERMSVAKEKRGNEDVKRGGRGEEDQGRWTEGGGAQLSESGQDK